LDPRPVINFEIRDEYERDQLELIDLLNGRATPHLYYQASKRPRSGGVPGYFTRRTLRWWRRTFQPGDLSARDEIARRRFARLELSRLEPAGPTLGHASDQGGTGEANIAAGAPDLRKAAELGADGASLAVSRPNPLGGGFRSAWLYGRAILSRHHLRRRIGSQSGLLRA